METGRFVYCGEGRSKFELHKYSNVSFSEYWDHICAYNPNCLMPLLPVPAVTSRTPEHNTTLALVWRLFCTRYFFSAGYRSAISAGCFMGKWGRSEGRKITDNQHSEQPQLAAISCPYRKFWSYGFLPHGQQNDCFNVLCCYVFWPTTTTLKLREAAGLHKPPVLLQVCSRWSPAARRASWKEIHWFFFYYLLKDAQIQKVSVGF